MKYILDFDRTLFDTDRMYSVLEKQGVRHLAGTAESLDTFDVPGLLFSDAISFLHSHKRDDLFVVSSVSGKTADWDLEYQKTKLHMSGIGDLVKKVCAVYSEKATAIKDLQLNTKAVFVDDMEKNVLSVCETNPNVLGVIIDRKGESASSKFPIIYSLDELDAIIKS